LQQFGNLSWEQRELLDNSEIQEFFQHEQNQQHIGQIATLTPAAVEALKTPWVRDQITDGDLCWEQFTALNWGAQRALCDKEVQSFLELKRYRKYIGQIVNLSPSALEALKNSWVWASVADRKLPLRQLASLTFDGQMALCSRDIQRFLDLEQNQPYIKQIANFSDHAARALWDVWVRKQITNGVLRWQQFVSLTLAGRVALCNIEVQSFLDLEQNQPYIEQVANFSSTSETNELLTALKWSYKGNQLTWNESTYQMFMSTEEIQFKIGRVQQTIETIAKKSV